MEVYWGPDYADPYTFTDPFRLVQKYSYIYMAEGLGEETTEADTAAPDPDTTVEPDTAAPDTTDEVTTGEATVPADTTPSTDKAEDTTVDGTTADKGCGSTLCGMALLLVAGAAVIAVKKKED